MGCGATSTLTGDPGITCSGCNRLLKSFPTLFGETPLLGSTVYYEGETIGSIIKAQVGHIPEERRETLIVKPLEKDGVAIIPSEGKSPFKAIEVNRVGVTMLRVRGTPTRTSSNQEVQNSSVEKKTPTMPSLSSLPSSSSSSVATAVTVSKAQEEAIAHGRNVESLEQITEDDETESKNTKISRVKKPKQLVSSSSTSISQNITILPSPSSSSSSLLQEPSSRLSATVAATAVDTTATNPGKGNNSKNNLSSLLNAKSCIRCSIQESSDVFLLTHRHAPKKFNGEPIYLCNNCMKVNNTKRSQQQQQRKQQQLDREYDTDEYCAICSADAESHYIICSHPLCHRTFCPSCLKRLLDQKEFDEMESSEEWVCFACTNIGRTLKDVYDHTDTGRPNFTEHKSKQELSNLGKMDTSVNTNIKTSTSSTLNNTINTLDKSIGSLKKNKTESTYNNKACATTLKEQQNNHPSKIPSSVKSNNTNINKNASNRETHEDLLEENEFQCVCGNIYGSMFGLNNHKSICQVSLQVDRGGGSSKSPQSRAKIQKQREESVEVTSSHSQSDKNQDGDQHKSDSVQYMWVKSSFLISKKNKSGKKLNYYRSMYVWADHFRCTFSVGDHVMLPSDNHDEPELVGKILEMFEIEGKKSMKVNIQWFYRIEDLLQYFKDEKEIIQRICKIPGIGIAKVNRQELFMNYDSQNVNAVQAISSKFDCLWLNAIKDTVPSTFDDYDENNTFFTRFTCKYNHVDKKFDFGIHSEKSLTIERARQDASFTLETEYLQQEDDKVDSLSSTIPEGLINLPSLDSAPIEANESTTDSAKTTKPSFDDKKINDNKTATVGGKNAKNLNDNANYDDDVLSEWSSETNNSDDEKINKKTLSRICPHCKETFTSHSAVVRHIRDNCSVAKENKLNKSTKIVYEKQQLKCEHCKKVFTTAAFKKRHLIQSNCGKIAAIHKKDNKPPPQMMKCICGEKFLYIKDLDAHTSKCDEHKGYYGKKRVSSSPPLSSSLSSDKGKAPLRSVKSSMNQCKKAHTTSANADIDDSFSGQVDTCVSNDNDDYDNQPLQKKKSKKNKDSTSEMSSYHNFKPHDLNFAYADIRVEFNLKTICGDAKEAYQISTDLNQTKRAWKALYSDVFPNLFESSHCNLIDAFSNNVHDGLVAYKLSAVDDSQLFKYSKMIRDDIEYAAVSMIKNTHSDTEDKDHVMAVMFTSDNTTLVKGLYDAFIHKAPGKSDYEKRQKLQPGQNIMRGTSATTVEYYLVLLTRGLSALLPKAEVMKFVPLEPLDPRTSLKVSNVPLSYDRTRLLLEMQRIHELNHVLFYMPMKVDKDGVITGQHTGIVKLQISDAIYVKGIINTFNGYKLKYDVNGTCLKVEYDEDVVEETSTMPVSEQVMSPATAAFSIAADVAADVAAMNDEDDVDVELFEKISSSYSSNDHNNGFVNRSDGFTFAEEAIPRDFKERLDELEEGEIDVVSDYKKSTTSRKSPPRHDLLSPELLYRHKRKNHVDDRDRDRDREWDRDHDRSDREWDRDHDRKRQRRSRSRSNGSEELNLFDPVKIDASHGRRSSETPNSLHSLLSQGSRNRGHDHEEYRTQFSLRSAGRGGDRLKPAWMTAGVGVVEREVNLSIKDYKDDNTNHNMGKNDDIRSRCSSDFDDTRRDNDRGFKKTTSKDYSTDDYVGPYGSAGSSQVSNEIKPRSLGKHTRDRSRSRDRNRNNKIDHDKSRPRNKHNSETNKSSSENFSKKSKFQKKKPEIPASWGNWDVW